MIRSPTGSLREETGIGAGGRATLADATGAAFVLAMTETEAPGFISVGRTSAGRTSASLTSAGRNVASRGPRPRQWMGRRHGNADGGAEHSARDDAPPA